MLSLSADTQWQEGLESGGVKITLHAAMHPRSAIPRWDHA